MKVVIDSTFYTLRSDLRILRDTLPALSAEVGEQGLPEWRERLERHVLPAIDFDLPVLLVAVCGGGSTGKSTLVNMLADAGLARVGFRAGLTRRVLLAGHPDVLSGPQVAEALLHRLPDRPVPWRTPDDASEPGPPLYAQTARLPRNLLLIDTPDFDTGREGRMINRELAEPVLRTAEVLIYVFTNVVYNNLSNTRFMAEVVGGIGGRPTILVYRISRVADDAEVEAHCLTVARHLYAGDDSGPGGFPRQVIGVYRMHESDAVARGEALPRLIPISSVTQGRDVMSLLADLDAAEIKRHVFAADLARIGQEARVDMAASRRAARRAALYERGLDHVMAEQALEALQAFPAGEAVELATRLFLETSPGLVKLLRGTGRVVSAPLRGALALGRRLVGATNGQDERPPVEVLRERLGRDLLLSANALRNRLMDDALIMRVGEGDELLRAVESVARDEGDDTGPMIEPLGSGTYNLHLPAPERVRAQEETMLAQDWAATTRTLQRAVHELVGLPTGVEQELRAQIADFRQSMSWQQRVREAFFASLSALPPILGVSYMLLTANPVVGSGLWIQLESLLGLNDLWALVSIPASAGLSAQDRRQLEGMLAPVFRMWLERRAATIVSLYRDTVCRPVLEALEQIPSPEDSRFAEVERALNALGEAK
jgi:hypothetical protein